MDEPATEIPRPRSPTELQRVIALERAGAPFLLYRDGAGEQVEVSLGSTSRLSIGRDDEMDIPVPATPGVTVVRPESPKS